MPRAAKLAESVAAKLREEILEGSWSDRPLPSERELSAKLGVARLTARRALKRLCAEQLIEARPGKGYVIVPGTAGGEAPPQGREVIYFFLDRVGTMAPDSMDAEILSGASAEARRQKLELYSTCQEPEVFKRIVRERKGKSLRGVLLDWAEPQMAKYLLDAGVPFVVVEDDLEGLPVASVVQDNAGGTRAALEHLTGLGHQRIALAVSALRDFHPMQRAAAYREFMLRSGLGVSPELIGREPGGPEGGRKATARLLDLDAEKRPTAIYVASGGMVEGVIAELRSRGLECRRDISVVVWRQGGARDAGRDLPNLTHVYWDRGELGRMAMLTLEERIRAGRPERMVFKIEARVVDRGSTAKPKRS
ncbi:MAG: GntR family transcriptional regulator [Planctomycetota bacterium]|jgi:LacI family transcriptional regulator